MVDNGSSHRGEAACERLAARWPNAQLVQLPVHASWLNQVEIYNSIIQRKMHSATTSNWPKSSAASVPSSVAYQQSAAPFEWKFTRNDLALLMKKLADKPDYQAAAMPLPIRDRNYGPEHLGGRHESGSTSLAPRAQAW